MTHPLRFLLALPVVLLTGWHSVQAQCSRSGSHCSRPAHSSAQVESAATPAPRRVALLRLGMGASLSGSGDYSVLKTHLEYAPQLGRHWRLGSRLAYIGGSQPLELGDGFTVPQSYRALNAEQEIHWLPFGAGRVVEFGLGGGVFAGYGQKIGFSHYGYSTDANGNRSHYSYDPHNEQGFHVGYLASLYVDVALDRTANWRLGGRLALQNDSRANILPGGQLQLSRAL